MRERVAVAVAVVAVPFLMGTAASTPADERVVLRFQDPAIVEASGLVAEDGFFVTTNDSGDTGRVFAVDARTGETAGVTSWASDPEDVEALAPAGRGEVWVGDIGDNLESRGSVRVTRVPIGAGDRSAAGDVVRPGLSGAGPGRRDAAEPPGHRPAVRGQQGHLRGRGVRRAAPALLDRAEPAGAARAGPHLRHRRRVLPGRAAPDPAQLRRCRRLHLPGAGAGRRPAAARPAAGRGDRDLGRPPGLRHLRGPPSAGGGGGPPRAGSLPGRAPGGTGRG